MASICTEGDGDDKEGAEEGIGGPRQCPDSDEITVAVEVGVDGGHARWKFLRARNSRLFNGPINY
jgi:hypothetical protein